jgi:KDO2-lipid IV(A) lauroyltransferase
VNRPTVAHRAEYLVVAVVSVAVRALPERVALGLGSTLGWVAGTIFRIRRSVVRANLERAFPEEEEGWRSRVTTASYRHLGREAVALLRMRSLNAPELAERCRIEGLDLVESALEGEGGVVLLTGHLGNWEMAGAGTAANGIPLDVVVRRQSNPMFDEYMRDTRERLGMRVVYQADAPRLLLRGLRTGRAAALVADQNVPSGGAFVEFFGVPAATARGPAVLATRAGVGVLMAVIRSLPGPVAKYSLRFFPVRFEPSDDPDENAVRLLRTYHALLESAIREAPEQYFWMHRRWKTRPAAEEPDRVREVPREPRPLEEST